MSLPYSPQSLSYHIKKFSPSAASPQWLLRFYKHVLQGVLLEPHWQHPTFVKPCVCTTDLWTLSLLTENLPIYLISTYLYCINSYQLIHAIPISYESSAERRNAQNSCSFLKYNHAINHYRNAHNLLLWNSTGQATFTGTLLNIPLSMGERGTQKIHLFVFALQGCLFPAGKAKATLSHLLATSSEGEMPWLTAGEHLHLSNLHCRALVCFVPAGFEGACSGVDLHPGPSEASWFVW